MKRFHISMGALALAVCSLLLPGNATAQKLTRIYPDGRPSQQTEKKGEVKPFRFTNQKNLGGLSQSNNFYSGFGLKSESMEGLQRIPTVMQQAKSPITRSAYEPRGTVYAVCPQFKGIYSYDEAFYASVDLASGKMDHLFSGICLSNLSEYQLQGGAVRNGYLYIPQFSIDYVMGEYYYYWKEIDLATGELIKFQEFSTPELGFCYTLTYDESEDKFYGFSYDVAYDSPGALVCVDPNKVDSEGRWAVESIASINSGNQGKFFCSVAYCPIDQKLYGMQDSGKMYIINKTTGATTIAADLASSEYAVPSYYTTQPLVYSPLDKAFVTIYKDFSAEEMQLVFIDADTYEVIPGEYLSEVAYVASLYCADQYAKDKAPGPVAVSSIAFDKDALNGSITFTAPKLHYDLTAITADNMTIVAMLDGKEFFNAAMKPGEEKTLDLNLEQGLHEIVFTASFSDELVGPNTNREFFVGNDNPQAPTNLKNEGNQLTWEAPGAVGQHEGYVDVADITYNVYFDDTKVNAEPIKGTSYTFETPSTFARRDISVTAVSHDMESFKSMPVNKVFGKAMDLPVSFKPTAEEATVFQTINNPAANENGFEFEAATNYVYSPVMDVNAFAIDVFYYEYPDNWLIFPLINFPSNENLYYLSMSIASYFGNDESLCDLALYLGKEPTAKAMTEKIFELEGYRAQKWETLDTKFAVKEAGDYYIGLHLTGLDNGKYRGCRLSNIELKSIDGSTTKAPDMPTNVVLNAGPKGSLSADFSFTAPTTDIMGRELDKNADITFTAACGNNKATATGKPGAKVEVSVKSDVNGINHVYLTPSSAAGEGISRHYVLFIGVDVPSAPENIHGVPTSDNRKLAMTWDAPTIGENGGYVDPDNLTYKIYAIRNSGSTWNATLFGETKECSYTFDPQTDILSNWHVGPGANNEMGESKNANFYTEMLGKPYEIPAIENFGSSSFAMSPWMCETTGIYADYTFSSFSYISGPAIGNVNFVDGGLCAYFDGEKIHPGHAQLKFPKVTTKGTTKATVTVTFYDYAQAPALEIWGRCDGSPEKKKLGDLEVKRGEAGWREAKLLLPQEFQNNGWVQLFLEAIFEGDENECCIIEGVGVTIDVECDYKLRDLEGRNKATVGKTAEYTATVINAGTETIGGTLNISLQGDGKVLRSKDFNISRLQPSKAFSGTAEFEFLQDYTAYKELKVVATTYCEGDEVENDNTREMTIELMSSSFPVVSDLAASWNDDKDVATLEWSEPSLTYGEFNDFETNEPFQLTEQIGLFKNYDMDGAIPWGFNNARFENDDKPSAWIVLDTDQLPLFQTMERTTPHSGHQMICARSNAYDETDPNGSEDDEIPASDWLVSPEIVGGSEISFWFSTIDGNYAETIELWYSKTDDKLESFSKIRNFTKTGDEGWEFVEYKLPSDAKYFALKYASIGMWAALVDDIVMTPKELPSYILEGYSLYRAFVTPKDNGNWSWGEYSKIADLDKPGYVDEIGNANVRYVVYTNIKADGKTFTGPASNEAKLYQAAIDDVTYLGGVYGGKGEIIVTGHAGEQMSLYTADGKFVKLATIATDNQSVGVDAGIYMVKIGNGYAKVLVK